MESWLLTETDSKMRKGNWLALSVIPIAMRIELSWSTHLQHALLLHVCCQQRTESQCQLWSEDVGKHSDYKELRLWKRKSERASKKIQGNEGKLDEEGKLKLHRRQQIEEYCLIGIEKSNAENLKGASENTKLEREIEVPDKSKCSSCFKKGESCERREAKVTALWFVNSFHERSRWARAGRWERAAAKSAKEASVIWFDRSTSLIKEGRWGREGVKRRSPSSFIPFEPRFKTRREGEESWASAGDWWIWFDRRLRRWREGRRARPQTIQGSPCAVIRLWARTRQPSANKWRIELSENKNGMPASEIAECSRFRCFNWLMRGKAEETRKAIPSSAIMVHRKSRLGDEDGRRGMIDDNPAEWRKFPRKDNIRNWIWLASRLWARAFIP